MQSRGREGARVSPGRGGSRGGCGSDRHDVADAQSRALLRRPGRPTRRGCRGSCWARSAPEPLAARGGGASRPHATPEACAAPRDRARGCAPAPCDRPPPLRPGPAAAARGRGAGVTYSARSHHRAPRRARRCAARSAARRRSRPCACSASVSWLVLGQHDRDDDRHPRCRRARCDPSGAGTLVLHGRVDVDDERDVVDVHAARRRHPSPRAPSRRRPRRPRGCGSRAGWDRLPCRSTAGMPASVSCRASFLAWCFVRVKRMRRLVPEASAVTRSFLVVASDVSNRWCVIAATGEVASSTECSTSFCRNRRARACRRRCRASPRRAGADRRSASPTGCA